MSSIVNVPPASGRTAASLDNQWLGNLVWEFLYLDGQLGHYRARLPGVDESWHIVRPTSLAAADALRRVEREYSLAGTLRPAWSLQPLALLQSSDGLLLVLTDPGGRSLHQAAEDGYSIEAFLALAEGAAVALAHTHGAGLLHRDIKPCNLVEGADGVVRLTGFGLSIELGQGERAVICDSICGTLAYMSPEQARRVERQADERSDLYSLGMTFYEWLTGQLPFDAADAVEWVYCHVARQPPPLSQFRGDIPAPLARLVLKLIAKNPADRYRSAQGLAADLRACLAQWRQCQDIPDFEPGQCEAGAAACAALLSHRQADPQGLLPLAGGQLLPAARASISIPGGQDTLDLVSVMKANQALCEEILLDRLIEILLTNTIMHAGAQRALLLLVQDEAPVICATGQSQDGGIVITLASKAPDKNDLPLSILYRVMRTRQRLVFDDVRNDPYCSADQYLLRRTLRSVLCLPLIKQGQVIGVLYLENNLAPGVFTSSRTTVLELLAGQAAISLETARLYAELVEENARRKDTETALRNARAELERVSKATVMGELAASIAHEINQPLASIVSNAAASLRWLDRETPVVEEAMSGLRDIVDNGRRAGQIVSALQSLARQTPQHRQRVQINDVIRHVVALTINEVEQQRVLLTTHLTRSPLRVYASSVQLQQVVLNLIVNALDAMSGGDHVLRRLSITSEVVGDEYVVVSVEDSGIGVAPENMDKLFNAFFSTKDKGIEAHAGCLHVMPARYGGTTFVFVLPVGMPGA
jgi:signal transduction histidine kinase/serine/threonine protein kinase